jgi:hypothetical protein
MTPMTDTERWMAIETQALNSLRGAGSSWRGVGSFRQVFHFLIVPSFSIVTAYSLSERREPLDGYRYYCVRTKWDRPYDTERFESSMRMGLQLDPTLERALVKLTDEFAESILAEIANVSLPLFVQHSIQIDGTVHEFSCAHVTLTWGETVPDEWTPLSNLAMSYVERVEKLAASQPETALER